MCIGSTSSFFSTFVLALASFVFIWNYSKIKNNIRKILNFIRKSIEFVIVNTRPILQKKFSYYTVKKAYDYFSKFKKILN